MAASILDQYPQWAVLKVPGVAAATGGEIAQLQTGITNLQKVAWAVKEIDYLFPYSWMGSAMVNVDSYIGFAVTQSAHAAQNPSPDNPAILDFASLGGKVKAVGGGEAYAVPSLTLPIRHLFEEPVLLLPQNIYGFLFWDTDDNLNTLEAMARIWYKEVELGPQDWYDLLQLRLPLGATV
jgi:hypothetical protein